MIEPVNSNQHLSFTGYQHPLKTLFKKGLMPSVKRGLYDTPIDASNVSLEHLKPHSWGGKTEYGNLALAARDTNTARGSRPLADILTWDMLEKYLSQFNFRIKNIFNGYEYQDKVRKTCEHLGVAKPPKAPEVENKKLPKKILRSMRNKQKKLDIQA